MIQTKLRGKRGFFVNFMFNALPGGQKARLQQMHKEIERFHGLLTRHIVRKPESAQWRRLRPILILAPDLPVPKRKKTSFKRTAPNDGLHVNGILLVPKRRRDIADGSTKRKQSRLGISMKKHLREKEHIFKSEHLDRVHLTRINRGTMADYMFKTI